MEALSCGGGYRSEEDTAGMRKGPWTQEEDSILAEYVAIHGEGRWNTAARCAGLKRTGKSCRLRWLNYLRPDVRRGNISLEEQLWILELHSRWGNRWSKIAQYLPGRTDNEIKNYWRTRVQKLAKQLKCDVNSKQFRDTMRYVWMPLLIQRINASSSSSPGQPASTTTTTTTGSTTASCYPTNQTDPTTQSVHLDSGPMSEWIDPDVKQDPSPDCFDTQFSPISDITDCPNYQPTSYHLDCTQNGSGCPGTYESGKRDAGYGQHGKGSLLDGEESLWANDHHEIGWFSTTANMNMRCVGLQSYNCSFP